MPFDAEEIEVAQRGPFTVLRPSDRMAGSHADELSKRLTEALDGDSPFVAIDFSRVDYFSSRTIGVLAQVHKSAAERGGKLIIGGINDTMMKMIKYVNLDKLLSILPSRGEFELLLKRAEDQAQSTGGLSNGKENREADAKTDAS